MGDHRESLREFEIRLARLTALKYGAECPVPSLFLLNWKFSLILNCISRKRYG